MTNHYDNNIFKLIKLSLLMIYRYKLQLNKCIHSLPCMRYILSRNNQNSQQFPPQGNSFITAYYRQITLWAIQIYMIKTETTFQIYSWIGICNHIRYILYKYWLNKYLHSYNNYRGSLTTGY